MASQSEDASDTASAQVVGHAFVSQYYQILHTNPEEVHKFYNSSSVLNRLGTDGVMSSITTLEAIKDKILSLDYLNYQVEILTADSELSFNNGVIVLVTGILTGKENTGRKFSQVFFLAPQENGYFVLNDVFRFISESVEVDTVENNHVEESAPKTPLMTDPKPTVSVSNQTTSLANGTVPLSEKRVADLPKKAEDLPKKAEDLPKKSEDLSKKSEDVPKKTFASVVQLLKDNSAPFQSRVPPVKPAEPSRASAAPEATIPSSNSTREKTDDHAAKTHAIFVPNLPMSATVEQLEAVFKNFGPIKHNGIQVRSSKQQGTCFGFVEFESASSMQSAIEKSPIEMLDREVRVEERRANNDRGRFSGRAGYRNDNFRGRGNFSGGNFSGGRGYGRNDFERRGDFSNRTRGNAGRNEETGHRVYQNGGGKAIRQASQGSMS
ncbi:hypothetical protein ACB098_03G191100 [Castanea mollissima]